VTDDFIDATFADLDEYYPGSKRKRKAVVVKEPTIKPDATWDSRPYKKPLPNGKELELFTIGALAAALGRPVITIRHWTKKGYLPVSPYRLPSTTNRKGDSHLGRRLYSRAMVEAVIELFEKAGVLDIDRIEWLNNRQLSNEIAEAWGQIRATETN